MSEITLTGVDIAIDESAGLQDLLATPNQAEDANDNDLSLALLPLPPYFSTQLNTLGVGPGTAMGAALSGYTGAAGNTGANLITITGSYLDLAFTDAEGKLLGDPNNLKLGQDWSGLYTLDGTKIFLYTYSGDSDGNNIVLGRIGSEGPTAAPGDDVANPNGTIVFAGYLQETATGAKIWMVQYAPLLHPDATNPDDSVNLADHLFVTAQGTLDFAFTGLPSGQNEFLMFQATSSEVGLIVTGKDPDKVVNGKLAGDTVNTSQGGGPTTIGTNNQAIDPPKGSAPGEAMIFTFVNTPNPAYTVPNLTHDEATTEANIDYVSLHGATGGTIDIAQQTPPKAATATISAYTTAEEKTTGYYEGLLDNDDVLAYITSVTIRDASGAIVTGFDGITANKTLGGLSVTFTDVDLTSQPGFEARTVTIGGFQTGYKLEYTTSAEHNRVMVENVGGPKGSSPFDIGGFHLPGSAPVTQEVGSLMGFEDDAPTASGAVTDTVDEDGLTGQSTGIPGIAANGDVDVPNDDFTANTGDNNEATTTGSIAGIFASGADEPLLYGFSDITSGVKVFNTDSPTPAQVTLFSNGDAVKYDVQGNILWGYVGAGAEYVQASDRAVFKFELTDTSTGAYKFTLLDQLDHPSQDGVALLDNTENELLLQLGTILQATDKDGDTVTAVADKLVITVDDDTPVVTAKSNLVYANSSNPFPGGTGVFAYAIGADERTGSTYSASNSDFGTITLSGTVGGKDIEATEVKWFSENDSQAVFDLNYTYESNNPTQGAKTVIDTETATLTFNKLAGTYTLNIPEIESFSILKTSTPTNPLQGYAVDSAAEVKSNPPVSVMTLAPDFFVQFEGFADKNDPISFAYNGGLFSNTHEYVTISTNTIGVSGDTVQSNEVIDLDFFSENPKGFTSGIDQNNQKIPAATSKAFYVKMDGIGSEDLLVVLKLVNNNGDEINRTFIVDNEDIFTKPNSKTQPAAATAYGVTLDNNDGVMIFESNDYNFGSETYSIKGMQIVTETQGLSGEGYEFVGGIDDPTTAASEGATQANSKHPFDATTDDSGNEPIKITEMGFVASTTPDAHLKFNVVVKDADGDATAPQTLDVSIVGGNGVTASASADSFVIGSTDVDGLLSMVTTVIDGGFTSGGSGGDKLDFTVAGTGSNYTEELAPAANLAAFITAADGALTNTANYYFGVVGGDGYLAFDGDGNGITAIIQLVGVTDMASTDIF